MVSDGSEALMYGVISPTCFGSLVEQRNFGDIECAKAVLSKLAGYAIVFGSCVLVLPTIFNVLSSKGTAGLKGMSESGKLLQTIGYSWAFAYNMIQGHSLSTYGESIILYAQHILLLAALLYVDRKNRAARAVTAILGVGIGLALPWVALEVMGGSSAAVLQSVVDQSGSGSVEVSATVQSLLIVLFWSQFALFLSSKLAQAYAALAALSTGAESGFGLLLQAGGSSVRLLTTLQEVKDVSVLINNGLMGGINVFLFGLYVLFEILGFGKSSGKQSTGAQVEQGKGSLKAE